MRWSNVPMPLTEGEYPLEKQFVEENGKMVLKYCQLEESDIGPEEPPGDYGEYTIDSYNEEYYDRRTFCKSCGVEFIAYRELGKYHSIPVRNYCPGCGKRLAKEDDKHGSLEG